MIDLPMIIAAFLIGWPGVAQAIVVDVATALVDILVVAAGLVAFAGALRGRYA